MKRIASRFALGVILAALLWSLLVAASLGWNIYHQQQEAVQFARLQANAYINKDLTFRSWATSHGGVYVRPTEKSPPNPYLRMPNRDVVTTEGIHLTLINPAYMMRQVLQDFSAQFGIRDHLTSLRLKNPDNAPDDWERKALLAFEQGSREVGEIIEGADGKRVMRFMRPVYMEEGCLKCHGDMGLKAGDVRGGLSTTVDMEPFYTASASTIRAMSATHAGIWLVGLFCIGVVTWRLRLHAAEREQRLEALKKYSAELEAANKDIEEFSYSVSHDLRAPLRAIDGFSGILLKEYAGKLDDEGKRLLGVVSENARKMGRLIDGILAFSYAGRKEMKHSTIGMEELVRDVREELRPENTGRLVQVDIRPLPPATGDRAMIRQVLSILLSNALKFTGPKENARIEIGGYPDGQETVFYVKDNGVGFDMRYVDMLFGVSRRLHGMKEFEGAGAGLAIVKRIVTRHGGRVWAEGKVDEGATVYFALPTEEAAHG
jgi:signal transduction histidine kinase